MKALVSKLTKTNLIAAIVVACLFALASNAAFNFTGALFVNANTVSTINNLFDGLQLVLYVGYRLKVSKSLNRYDLPIVCAGLASLIS